jgi:Nif-specific regulatory protein
MSDMFTLLNLPIGRQVRGSAMDALKDKIEEIEKEEIIKALQECNWIKVRAAKKLGITERMIGYKI